MPELPEVETIVRDLNSRAPKILGACFVDAWTDAPKIIKKPKNFSDFKKQIRAKKIKKIWRRAKNIIFDLSGGLSLLVHQKMTGHLLYSKWQMANGRWQPLKKGVLQDSVNLYIHLMFWLDNGFMLGLSDLRKFAKVELWNTAELINLKEFKELGPEPLDKSFTFKKFEEAITKKKGKIKQVLMDQKIIAGIGNIYSDEILWRAKIHPAKNVSGLDGKELKSIYRNVKKVLKTAVGLRGESFSDYRDTEGRKGNFDKARMVYQRKGEKCRRCGAVIKKLKIGGRSAHFCPHCQLL